MTTDHIFVYGSLRSECTSPGRSILNEHAEWVGKATFRGKLYKINWYPGVVESENPDDVVTGEVYQLTNRETALTKLDRYEGCSPDTPQPHEFSRKEKRVLLQNGEEITAWVYLYVSSVEGKEQIHSGDYVEYEK